MSETKPQIDIIETPSCIKAGNGCSGFHQALSAMTRKDKRIRELVQQCEKLREERNAVRVKVEQPLLLRVRALESVNADLRKALRFALEWIDAVPPNTVLPTMPGFDRDWVENVQKEPPR